MSLFDVIRYPISDSPTLEQLKALPEDLYTVWIKRAHFIPENWSHKDIVWYYRPDRRTINSDKEIKLLRQMIEEYDESL